MNMVNATHTEAVTVLKNMKDVCRMVVSREVLVVMPEEQQSEKAEGEHRKKEDEGRQALQYLRMQY